MKRSFAFITLAVFATIASLNAEAAMIMKKKAAAPEGGQPPAAAATPGEAPAPSNPEKKASSKAPDQAAEKKADQTPMTPAKEDAPAPDQSAAVEAKPEGEAAKTAPARKNFKQGYVGSIAYVQGEKALIDCAEELPPKTYMVVYDEKFLPHGVAVLGRSKGKNMYLAKIAEGDASVGNRVSIETEEEAFLRVSKNKSPEAVKEFAALYPDSPRRAELEK